MSTLTFNNTSGKIILNTAQARQDGTAYVWDTLALPLTDFTPQTVIHVENCYKTGGTSNLSQRTISFTSLSPPKMDTQYSFSNLIEFHTLSTAPLVQSDYVYFQTQATPQQTIYRLRFSSNAPVANVADLRDLESSTDGTTWSTVTSGLQTNTPITIYDNYLNLIDVYRNKTARLRNARFYFAGNNIYLPAVSPADNEYTAYFTEFGRFNWIHFYVPSTNAFARMRFNNATSSSVRAVTFQTTTNGGITWSALGDMANIPYWNGGASVPCDCVIIERNQFPKNLYSGSTNLYIDSLHQAESFDSTNKADTQQIATLSNGVMQTSALKKDIPFNTSIGIPNLTNIGKNSGSSIRLTLAPTSNPTTLIFPPYGDTLQLTLKVSEYNEGTRE